MSEIKTVFIIAIVFFLIGAAAGGGVILLRKAGEISEIKSDLRDAVERSEGLRERVRASAATVEELEGISTERRETIAELEEEIFFHIERARERDRIIANLEGRVKDLRGRAAKIGNLAKEGRDIVAELLDAGDS